MSLFSKIKELIKNSAGTNYTHTSYSHSSSIQSNGDIIINGLKVGNKQGDKTTLKQIVGSGIRARMGLPLEDFSAIDCSILGDVQINQEKNPDQGSSAIIECDDNLIDKLDIFVKNGVLNISFKANTWIKTKLPLSVNVYTQVDNIRSITSEGVASITGEKIGRDYLFLGASGSSKIELNNILLDKLKLDTSGSSAITLSGEALDLEVEASGASQVSCENLRAQSARLDVSGASGVEINCENDLEAELSGASKLTLSQEPQTKEIDISGAASAKVKSSKKPKF